MNCKISHLSWLRKLSPTHTQPLISICESLKPYQEVGVGHEGVGWVIQGWGGVMWAIQGWGCVRWGGSCKGRVGCIM